MQRASLTLNIFVRSLSKSYELLHVHKCVILHAEKSLEKLLEKIELVIIVLLNMCTVGSHSCVNVQLHMSRQTWVCF